MRTTSPRRSPYRTPPISRPPWPNELNPFTAATRICSITACEYSTAPCQIPYSLLGHTTIQPLPHTLPFQCPAAGFRSRTYSDLRPRRVISKHVPPEVLGLGWFSNIYGSGGN